MATETLEIWNCSRQTQFCFITKTFEYLEDNESIKDLVDQLIADYTELERNSWKEFWKLYGNVIYENTWKHKYPDYAIEGKTDEEIEEWIAIWEAHVLEVYTEQWNIFQDIFYRYHNELKSSLELGIVESSTDDESVEIVVKVEIEDELCNLEEDFEQLKLFGLPTSFHGRETTRYNSKRKKLNKTIQPKEYLIKERIDSVNTDTDCVTDSDPDLDCDTDSAINIMEEKSKTISKRKPKKLKRNWRGLPKFMLEDTSLVRYWKKRFSLFSRFDEGIQLDRESWFSVTPEKVANHLARRLACDVIVDGFCGCGGNTIQFARTCKKVIAIDIDPEKLAMAKHNARIYGVEHKIEFILGDFMKICETLRLRADVIFLSPPWGGPNYKSKKNFDIEEGLLPAGATILKHLAHQISDNIVFYLPRNSKMSQVIKLCGAASNKCEVENSYLDTRLIAISAFYGDDIVGKQIV